MIIPIISMAVEQLEVSYSIERFCFENGIVKELTIIHG
jgi:hypothetical protein